MSIFKQTAFLIIISLFLTSCMEPAIETKEVRKIPLEDFFKNPEKTSYKISPSGTYLSYMAPYENRMNIFVQKIGDRKATRITGETERDIPGYIWKGDDHILYVKDFNGDENFHVVVVGKDGSDLKDLTPFEGVRAQIIDDLEDFPAEILVSLNKRNPQAFDPYRLNIITGEMKMIAENPGNITGWQTDHDGKLRIATTSDGVNTSLLYRDTEDEPFKTILTTSFKESLNPLFFTFDNKQIYASSNLGRDKSAIVKYDIANGEEIEMLFEHPDVDVSGLSYSRKRKVLTSINYTTWKLQREYLDDRTRSIYERLERELGNKEVVIVSVTDEEHKMLVRTYSDRSLGAYYLYDVASDQLEKLVEVSPWINEDEMAEMKPVKYQSRDGLTIHGYLTLPQGKTTNLPVVVNPHGGPWARDRWGFDAQVQFLANRGYGVLQMNFRGSTGYGKMFWEKSFKEWGKAMQDDITDGVSWLKEQKIAQPDKIAIYGASYGGYATLAGLAFTPDVYTCGVDYVGVSNLFTFMNTIPPYWKPYLEMMYEMVGHPEKDSVLMASASPVMHVEKITAPLFVAQGAKDPRVNIEESNQIVDAIRSRGVEVEYMVKENEGHGFRNQENRFEFYAAMEKFLAKHLKDEAAAEEPAGL